MVIGPKIEKNFFAFLQVSWPPDSKNPKKKNFFWHFFVRTYVCMSRPKSLNISRSTNARALILVSKHFYIWGIDAIKIVSELVRGFWVIPIFHFFEILKNFSFLGLSRGPFEIRWCTREQKSFHSWQENFWCSFFGPPVFNNGGVGENLSFSIMLNYLVTPLRYINTSGEKKLLLMTIKLLLDFVSTPW